MFYGFKIARLSHLVLLYRAYASLQLFLYIDLVIADLGGCVERSLSNPARQYARQRLI